MNVSHDSTNFPVAPESLFGCIFLCSHTHILHQMLYPGPNPLPRAFFLSAVPTVTKSPGTFIPRPPAAWSTEINKNKLVLVYGCPQGMLSMIVSFLSVCLR